MTIETAVSNNILLPQTEYERLQKAVQDFDPTESLLFRMSRLFADIQHAYNDGDITREQFLSLTNTVYSITDDKLHQ